MVVCVLSYLGYYKYYKPIMSIQLTGVVTPPFPTMEQQQFPLYQFEFSMYEVMMLKQFVDNTLLNWAGGDPDQQQFLMALKTGLQYCVLEHTFELEIDTK